MYNVLNGHVWSMAIFFILLLLYKSYLDHLDALQNQAAGICHRTIPSIESCWHAAAIGLTYRLLDEGHGDLKFFLLLNL